MRVAVIAEVESEGVFGLAAAVDAVREQLPKGAITCHHVAPNLGALLRARDLSEMMGSEGVNVVHLASRGPAAIAALFAASRNHLPVVASLPLAFTPAVADHMYVRTLAQLCRCFFAASTSARNELVSRGVPLSKVATWQPGVDATFFSPAKRSAALRERWSVSDERPAIVYVGTLSQEHGAQRLLSLELGLHRSHPMHRLIVIGDGPSRAELQLRCSQAVFMGHLTRPALAEALASADLFAWPSEASSTALAVLEAQASGLPVVLMERGSGRERVSDASAIACQSESDFIIATAGLVRTATRRRAMAHDARCHAIAQRWGDGLVPLIAEYHRAAAAYVTR